MEEIRKKINLALIVFGIIVVFLLAFLFTYLKSISVNQADKKIIESQIAPISQEKLDNNYQKEIKLVFAEAFNLSSAYYNKIASSTNNQSEILIDQLAEIKIRAMDMRVPDNKRNIHLSFVMIIDDLKNALDNNDNKNYQEKYASLLELQKEIL
jgi:hypothetical protein